ncbi:MAG TPA: hypothetical protein VGI48_10420 [Caldimonas sp.]|jgi:hypothetical protein
MKTMMPRIALALSAFAVVGASAQTYYSGQADNERRERNREEALADYQAGHTSARATMRHDAHEVAEATRHGGHEVARDTRHGAHEVAEETREVTHKSANAVRHAGHKTAEEARHVSNKANAKFGQPVSAGKANPDGINPLAVSSASPTAPSNGTTK